MTAAGEAARSTAAAVARRSYGKLVAFLAARAGDLAAAEDALSDTFATALADWPERGCPVNPEAWLLTVARRKLIDRARRGAIDTAATERLGHLSDGFVEAESAPEIPDRRLALMFACAHPAIEASARAPLILQAVVGLDAKTIAAAFLTSPAAMSKRLVRAKTKIRVAGIPFRIPDREELSDRLATVLESIYAAYTEGWTDPGRSDTVRADLAGEALFLARLAAELLPEEPEALGLLALVLHSEARRTSRRRPDGGFVPFSDQDPDRWDWEMIREAEEAIRRAAPMGVVGRYQLEAAIQSAHVYRRRTGLANWADVVRLYDALQAVAGSPVVAINRAVALAELEGVGPALAAMPDSTTDPRLVEYQPYWAATADLLARSGALDRARHAYRMAIGLERDPAVREFLERRRESLAPDSGT